MNPTKEELDAIQSYKDRVREILYYMPEIDSGLQKIGIIEAILTRYRDGELAEKDRWISVKERLPVIGQTVLCYRDIDSKSDHAYATTWSQEEERFYKLNSVTHWQPLPTPPTN